MQKNPETPTTTLDLYVHQHQQVIPVQCED